MDSQELTVSKQPFTINESKDYQDFACEMMALDKHVQNKNNLDPEGSKKYGESSYLEKCSQHQKEVLLSIKNAYNSIQSYKKSTFELAISLHELHIKTGATYQDIGRRVESASKKNFSKSTIYKLCQVGRLLKSDPRLKSIIDTEKLYQLSRLPIEVRQEKLRVTDDWVILDDIVVQESSRNKVKDSIKKIQPDLIRKKTNTNTASKEGEVIVVDESDQITKIKSVFGQTAPSSDDQELYSIDEVKDTLGKFLDFFKYDEEISEALSSCLTLLESA